MPRFTQLESSGVPLSQQSQNSLPLRSGPAEFRLLAMVMVSGTNWRVLAEGSLSRAGEETSPTGGAVRGVHALCEGMPGQRTLPLCRKQRKQVHNHLRQNMCPAHQNRSLANGPSHPRLDPEEIQMADVSGIPRSPSEPSLYSQPSGAPKG